ncbi:MAG: phage exclusion protein Lit family protein [Gallionellaceae bacterium]|jgi:hypothetical protein
MTSPITVLWGNIVHTFENVDASSLRMHRAVTHSGKLSESINYDNGKEKVRPPSADTKTREIYVQETYLAHLWAYIYSVFVMYEEGVQKPLINNTFDGSLTFETELLERAKTLFDWAVSLTREYSEWDEKLPNPRTHNSDKEKLYAEKVNGIFQHAVTYLMFHEFAHLTQGHDSFFIGMGDLSDADIAERIQIENEADQYAFNMLIKDHGDEKQRWTKGLSILFVIFSALLITSKARNIKQKSHPDLDNRILNVLHGLNLKTEEAQFYCWYLCSFAVKFFLLKHNINVRSGEFETAQDAFFYYLDLLDEIKNGSAI